MKRWGWSYREYLDTPPEVIEELLFIDKETAEVRKHLNKSKQWTKSSG